MRLLLRTRTYMHAVYHMALAHKIVLILKIKVKIEKKIITKVEKTESSIMLLFTVILKLNHQEFDKKQEVNRITILRTKTHAIYPMALSHKIVLILKIKVKIEKR